MVIDFHTHIFPEKIVKRTIDHLEQAGGVKAHTNGLRDGLLNSMKQAGVDYSVVLPVVTKPSQFETINAYAAEITGKDGIISFGGIHPDSQDYRGELDRIKELGLKGVKLHPDYQEVFIDDSRYVNIIRYALELELLVTIHSGIDIGLPQPVHCPPDRAAAMLKAVAADHAGPARIILAHTGGCDQWDDVEKYLRGSNVYFDISFTLGRIPDEQLIRIIRTHGSDRILFATDSPWDGQKEDLYYFRKLGLTEEEREKILWKNGAALLECI